jgi:hypothetical protein
MKNQKTVFITIMSALAFAFALAPETKAAPGPMRFPPPPTGVENVKLPLITIHSTDNVIPRETGSFVLELQHRRLLGGMYVNISVSGTAVPGVDYELLVSPVYIGQSGYGVIQVKTLRDPRGSAFSQARSVIVTLEPGAGYEVGAASSATMWIKPARQSQTSH